MSVLKGKKVYLGGPIQFEIGENWRLDVKKMLKSEFGLHVLDPYDDPKQQWVPALAKAQENRQFKKMRKIAKKFVRKDLCWVDRADFTIHSLPYKVPTAGSVHEITQASDRKKPALIVCETGREFIPFWYYGFIPLRYMFDNFTQIYEYLRAVEAKEHMKDDRWHYVYGLI